MAARLVAIEPWMDPVFLKCRDLGHHWDGHHVGRDGRNWEEFLRCDNCAAMKMRLLTHDGFIIRSRMVQYPKGYARPKGSGHVTKAVKAQVRVLRLAA